MCGIVASFDRLGRLTQARLAPALRVLAPRGPDDAGSMCTPDGRIALGHTRLAIVGIDDGHQPLHLPGRDLWAVVNGEFYDDVALRRQLTASGAVFRSQSDSELLLHLYERHGLACVEHLRGEFAFVLWDNREQKLIAGRDAFGVKPLCYATHDGSLSLASNAKALFALGLPVRWSHQGLRQALLWQYPLPQATLFAGVQQVPPGHLLVHERGRTRLQRWWHEDTAPPLNDPEEAATLFESALRQAVRRRLRAEVPLACHLSGGLDSSSILALAAEEGTVPAAFTVSFDDAGYDEAALARSVATRYGTRLDSLFLDRETLLDHLEAAVVATEGLAVNGHLPAKYLLNRRIKEAGYKVALSGEGADETLLGYPFLRVDWCRQNGVDETLIGANAASRGLMMPAGAMLDLSPVAQRLGFIPTWLRAKAGMGQRAQALLRPAFHDDGGPLQCWLEAVAPIPPRALSHPGQAAALWTASALPQYILKTLGDGCEAAFGIEGRPPFLDTDLWRVVRRLPLEHKIRHFAGDPPLLEEKHILRVLMRSRLPTAITARRKHPFVAPPLLPATDAVNTRLNDCLRDAVFAKLPCFDVNAVAALLESRRTWHDADHKCYDPILLTLLSLHALQKNLNPEEGA